MRLIFAAALFTTALPIFSQRVIDQRYPAEFQTNPECTSEEYNPNIIERVVWGAKEPDDINLSRYHRDYGITNQPCWKRIVLHITDQIRKSPAYYANNGADAFPRLKQNYQMNKGFADIAYNFLVGQDGQIYRGRLTDDIVPGHAGATDYAKLYPVLRQKELARDSHSKLYPKLKKGQNASDFISDIIRIQTDPDYNSLGLVIDADNSDNPTEQQIASVERLLRFYLQKSIEDWGSKYCIEEIITHSEVRQWYTTRGLETLSKLNPAACPGESADEFAKIISDIKKDYTYLNSEREVMLQDLREKQAQETGQPFEEQRIIRIRPPWENS